MLSELRQLDTEAQGPVVIVDSDKQFLGILDWWRLLLQNPVSGSVREYLITVKPVHPETPVIAAAANDEWHTRNWLPVVDHRDRVLGAVSREKVFRAAGSYAGSAAGGGDILLDLLADLVYMCEAVLLRAFSRTDPT